jgi:hypothetical protein
MARVWKLQSGLRVTGMVTNPAGLPVPNARIDVDPVGEPSNRWNTSCETDERGEFTCAGLLAGEYACTVGGQPQARSETALVKVNAEASPRIMLRTLAAGTLRVRIEDSSQLELGALVVLARPRSGAALLGRLDGDEFVFESLALGAYEVLSEPTPPGAARVVQLSRDGEVATLSLALPTAREISGRVLDDEGHGVEDAWVTAFSESVYSRMRAPTPVLSDVEGAFSLPGLLPGRYELHATSHEGEARLEGFESGRRGALLRMRSYGSLSGSVTSVAGEPIGNFRVAYHRTDDGQGSELMGSGGVWRLPRLVSGTYELNVMAAEGSAGATLELPPRGEVKVALRLETAAAPDTPSAPSAEQPEAARAP